MPRPENCRSDRDTGSCASAVAQSNIDHHVEHPVEHHVELPVVIRPAPLRLVDLERRARYDDEFAQALLTRPEFCAALARVVHARDGEARVRFADPIALAAHLRALPRG